jgi:hypothetical protein
MLLAFGFAHKINTPDIFSVCAFNRPNGKPAQNEKKTRLLKMFL